MLKPLEDTKKEIITYAWENYLDDEAESRFFDNDIDVKTILNEFTHKMSMISGIMVEIITVEKCRTVDALKEYYIDTMGMTEEDWREMAYEKEMVDCDYCDTPVDIAYLVTGKDHNKRCPGCNAKYTGMDRTYTLDEMAEDDD
jgi:uncharacterized Zn-finger protein